MTDRTDDFAKLNSHSHGYMKALAALVNLGSANFKGSHREWIDREEAMRLVPALRDHADALATMLRSELLRSHVPPSPLPSEGKLRKEMEE